MHTSGSKKYIIQAENICWGYEQWIPETRSATEPGLPWLSSAHAWSQSWLRTRGWVLFKANHMSVYVDMHLYKYMSIVTYIQLSFDVLFRSRISVQIPRNSMEKRSYSWKTSHAPVALVKTLVPNECTRALTILTSIGFCPSTVIEMSSLFLYFYCLKSINVHKNL